ncbi:transmembrane 220 family protein [Ningiella sp. W23]|uniref:transmembrane 220 family protein n=1 Tax=Ningiella sp. W23 TaxID=3023715 RepID=UPI003756B8CB
MSLPKLFYGLGTILFAVFAYLQFNDASQYGNHDAWIWIVLYGFAALINLSSLLTALPNAILYVWLGFTCGSLLFRMQDDQGNLHLDWLNPSQYWNEAGTQMVQQTNESGGLVILIVWAILHLLVSKRSNKKRL